MGVRPNFIVTPGGLLTIMFGRTPIEASAHQVITSMYRDAVGVRDTRFDADRRAALERSVYEALNRLGFTLQSTDEVTARQHERVADTIGYIEARAYDWTWGVSENEHRSVVRTLRSSGPRSEE